MGGVYETVDDWKSHPINLTANLLFRHRKINGTKAVVSTRWSIMMNGTSRVWLGSSNWWFESILSQ